MRFSSWVWSLILNKTVDTWDITLPDRVLFIFFFFILVFCSTTPRDGGDSASVLLAERSRIPTVHPLRWASLPPCLLIPSIPIEFREGKQTKIPPYRSSCGLRRLAENRSLWVLTLSQDYFHAAMWPCSSLQSWKSPNQLSLRAQVELGVEVFAQFARKLYSLA